MNSRWEIIGDLLLIAFGIILVYIFVVIELLGQYGQEQNSIIRRIELFMGVPIFLLGIERLIRDVRRK